MFAKLPVGGSYSRISMAWCEAMAGKPPRSLVGIFSRVTAVRDADGRTREAKIIKQTIADLVDHVGGQPSAC